MNGIQAIRTPHGEGIFKNESGDERWRSDFRYSVTQHAGGEVRGEIGNLFVRGDCRYPEKLAYYGAPVKSLTPEQSLYSAAAPDSGDGIQ